MIRYYCPSCEIGSEQSTCNVCGRRAEMKSSIYWCSHCNIPVWEEKCPICSEAAKYIATDIRPVFPEERLLMEVLLGRPLQYLHSSVWFGGGRYIVDGNPVRLTSSVWEKAEPETVIREIKRFSDDNTAESFDCYIERWVQANTKRYNDLCAEAMYAIQDVAKEHETTRMFVSFSGGKDSTVTSNLVVRALGTPSIVHLYGNTTLEFPETERYIDRFKKNNRKTPLLTAMNTEKNFFEMCDIVGPPSRVMRWCCTVFKTGAITKKIENTFPGAKSILTFYGIRRSESASRSKYERETESPKISKQKVFSPIIDWLDYDVWLYILTTGIDFNEAYRYGYTRVGCWCCPNNSRWSEFLATIYMPDQTRAWREQLVQFAKKVGKPDAEEYVKQGGWKARQGGNGLEISKRFAVSFKPCANEENAFNYELSRPISKELYELFKPFGTIDYEMGNQRLGEVYIIGRDGNPILRLQGRIGRNLLKVSILHLPLAGSPRIREAELKIKCQLSKYQICIGCMACTSVCKYDAIKIDGNGTEYRYMIDESKCVHCGQCINHFDGGCYMRDVIRTKDGA